MYLTYIVIYVGERNRVRDGQPALVFLLKDDVGRLLVDADAEAFQLSLDDSLVGQWLVDVQHDEDEMARLGHGDDLPSTTFAVFGALDDTWEIEHLDFGAIVHDLTGDRREGCELVGSGCDYLELWLSSAWYKLTF